MMAAPSIPPEALPGILCFLSVSELLPLSCLCRDVANVMAESLVWWLQLPPAIEARLGHHEEGIDAKALKKLVLGHHGVIRCPSCSFHQYSRRARQSFGTRLTGLLTEFRRTTMRSASASPPQQEARPESASARDQQAAAASAAAPMDEEDAVEPSTHEQPCDLPLPGMDVDVDEHHVDFSEIEACAECGEFLDVGRDAFDPQSFFLEKGPFEARANVPRPRPRGAQARRHHVAPRRGQMAARRKRQKKRR
ncbi:unnamed protein product [Vitrella brassicaformis CCMP3155]|uniref:F-box domain-containing protein n=1 Tax=Vitrella brassicaformis (strain CCMP3155) TaxID=1169540 RepID=A0A0G4FLW9_VITBC|nr:unnamed protein product [Vitrella brassicaformis CCMP3155]|eukprot:CEM15017.1 unnamed protein product [Vitrella brassicaformis CCMP3155]